MGRAGRAHAIGATVALLVLPGMAGACSTVTCSQTAPQPQTTFVGTATGVHDGTADFRVDSVQLVSGSPGDGRAPAVGATVTVHYSDDGQRFLQSGTEYRVVVDWEEERYVSDVHTAEDCGNTSGTVHADGSPINTARVSWLKVHRAVLALLLAPVAVLLALSVVLWWRRRPRTVRVDDRYL